MRTSEVMQKGFLPNCKFLSFFFILMLASGCSGGKISKLETASQSTKSEVKDLRELQAELNAAVSELRAELRELRGTIEELQYSSTGKTAELERTLRRFSARVPPPEGVPAELLNRDEEKIARNQSPAAELYRSGLLQIRAGDFENALKTFRSFVRQNPDTAYSDNSLFWSGVCLDKLGQYDRAIGAYNDVLVRYPAEDMVPASLYRLADSFVKLGSVKDALLTFDKLIDEYPRNTFAKQAKKRRSELKRRGKRSRRR